MEQPMHRLGSGPRRRRASMGFQRSRAALQRNRDRLSSEDSDDFLSQGKTQGWLMFFVYFCFDAFMIGVNFLVWSVAGLFLWAFSHIHDFILIRIVGFHYLYNVSWEDPRTDRQALNLSSDDHVLTIASACDNVLDFMIDGATVTAVDLNPYQLALCELKKAAFLELSQPEFFKIFAEQDVDLLRAKFPVLRKHMNTLSIEFWEAKLPSFGGFMYSGSSGWLAYILFRIMFPIMGFGWMRKAILEGVTAGEFRRMVKPYEGRLEFIAWVADSILVPFFAPLAGVPEAQLNLGNDRDGNIHTVIERVFLNSDLVEDNYFYLGYILGHYTERCCPRYLQPEFFSKLKRSIHDGKLILFHGTLADRLREDAVNDKPPSYTAAIMLDHLDWMDDAGVNEELSLLWPLLNDERGRVLWRSFSSEPHRAALKHLNAVKVDDGTGDRTGTYWGVWVAEKKTCEHHPELTTLFWNAPTKMTFVEKCVTGLKIVSFPVISKLFAVAESAASSFGGDDLSKNSHAKKIEAFYASQASAYDAFRENFLHARPNLATCLPLSPGKLTWIDVGAGTARNLEFFSVETLRRRFSKIYILDISASLLEVARQRVEAAGLSDVVELVLADFTDLSQKGKRALPGAGSVNLVTFSYSLSMIPDKRAALKQAARLLAPGGAIGIADFFYHGSSASYKHQPISKIAANLYDFGCKMWFKQDGVHLLENTVFAGIEAEVEMVCTDRFRGSVPLLPVLYPWHGYWIARKPVSDMQEEDELSASVFGTSLDASVNRSRSVSPARSRSRSPLPAK